VEMRARVSPVGAMGLMQIMPNAWAGSRSRHGLGVDPFDARGNILAGVAYLREMHDRCGPSGFLAANNAGPKRYEEYLATGRALPTEMQLYVTIPAPMIGGTPVECTLAIARRAIPWQEAAPFAARGSRFAGGIVLTISAIDRATSGRSLAGELALQPRAAGLFVGQASAGRSQ
jgi:soluble lytic murein transglycosylase-like protein